MLGGKGGGKVHAKAEQPAGVGPHPWILEKAHCIASDEKMGMVKLSLSPNGS